jgi:hypothetical protein
MMVAPLTTIVSANAPVQNAPVQYQNHDKISTDVMAQRLEAYLARHQNDKKNKQTPVEVVKSAANELGFDAANDTFSLASENHNSSIVQVIDDGNDYNVNLVRSANGQWIISSVD